MNWHFATYYAVLLLTVIAAHWRGSRCEQIGVWVAICGSIISSALSSPAIWGAFAFPVFIVDLMVLVGFWALALLSRSFWPYWATGWQLVGSLVHLQRGMFDDIHEKPYGFLSMYIAYPILGVIFAASFYDRKKLSEPAADT